MLILIIIHWFRRREIVLLPLHVLLIHSLIVGRRSPRDLALATKGLLRC